VADVADAEGSCLVIHTFGIDADVDGIYDVIGGMTTKEMMAPVDVKTVPTPELT
jgi:hypothetical protein